MTVAFFFFPIGNELVWRRILLPFNFTILFISVIMSDEHFLFAVNLCDQLLFVNYLQSQLDKS